MPSERIQRRIDALLDEVDEAAGTLDWERVRELCDGVLRLDPENEDARTYLAAAERDTGVGVSTRPTDVERHFEATPTPAAAPYPERFAGDLYEVTQHLGRRGDAQGLRRAGRAVRGGGALTMRRTIGDRRL